MKFAKFLRSPILKNISERVLLAAPFSLSFYCDNGINQYAVQKMLTDVFGASLLLLELGCPRHILLLYHLKIFRVFMRISKSFVSGAECEIYLSCYNWFLQFFYYRRRNKRLRETVASVLSCGVLGRSNNPYMESVVEPCGVSKNQKGIFVMWV